eukprot:CAMPEP_0119406500 /NCGR_PEP_ID=MMETSP1335-20130426/808_1 /TAXON_ID=259385 /ORGANISM="Chrysoculter rhomboideus, Strain RCC1486" /LENGTH=44 /DNA_ID= /DNA_START= /DNA_END= /DNA_ORIENTATION=
MIPMDRAGLPAQHVLPPVAFLSACQAACCSLIIDGIGSSLVLKE